MQTVLKGCDGLDARLLSLGRVTEDLDELDRNSGTLCVWRTEEEEEVGKGREREMRDKDPLWRRF